MKGTAFGSKPRHYPALDELRGWAAAVVVIYHMGQVDLLPTFMPRGYLAVDLFYVLSGVVVANAYEKHLRGGSMTFQAFVRTRFIRLSPLALLGALLGAVLLLLKYIVDPRRVEAFPVLLGSTLLNAALLPSFLGGAVSRYELFPGNGPLWSLHFELFFNLVWAACLTQIRTRYVAWIAGISTLAFVTAVLNIGNANLGWSQPSYALGWLRVCGGFMVGVFVFRTRDYGLTGRHLYLPLIICSLVAICIPVAHPVVDVVCICILFPGIVRAALWHDVTYFGKVLAEASYPIYVLHFPVIAIFSGVLQVTHYRRDNILVTLLAIAIVALTSWLALRFFDRPVRAALKLHWGSSSSKTHREVPAAVRR